MKVALRAAALLARLGYGLSRYRFLSVPLDRLLLAVLLAVPFWVGWRGWRKGFASTSWAAIALSLALFSTLLSLRLRGYVLFHPEEMPAFEGEPLLRPDEKVQVRGTGCFAVSGMRRRFIELPALIWITELGEYVLMARVQVRDWPLLQAPSEEEGMWYIFLRPKDIVSIAPGYLYFGLARRWAIQLRYREATGVEATAYISLDTPLAHRRMASELLARSGLVAR